MVLKGDIFHPFANLPGRSFFFPNGAIGLGEKFLFKAIRDLKAQGKTVFIVAHTSNVLSCVDKVLRVRDGEIESFGPPTANQNLLQA
jgi:ABC-type protease/lipase transport system fused ATPase/permease subunit